MPEEQNPKTKDFDSLLAEFTDKVLSGQAVEASNMGIEDEEMLSLQNMAVRLHQRFGSEPPDPAMARRIKARLAAEWQKSGSSVQRETFWNRGRRALAGMFSGRQRRVYALALAAAVIVLAVVAVPLSAGVQLPGTAVIGGNLIPVILLAGFVLAVTLWLFFRRKR